MCLIPLLTKRLRTLTSQHATQRWSGQDVNSPCYGELGHLRLLWWLILSVNLKGILLDEVNIWISEFWVSRLLSTMQVSFIKSVGGFNWTKRPASLSNREFFSRLPLNSIYTISFPRYLPASLQISCTSSNFGSPGWRPSDWNAPISYPGFWACQPAL